MKFLELKIAFSQLGYTLYKDRDYRGVGYFISNEISTYYIGSTIKEIENTYIQIKESKYVH